MCTEADFDAAQEQLAYFERTKQKILAIVTADLSRYVRARDFDFGVTAIAEAVDEMVYDEVKQARAIISDFEHDEARRHRQMESTFYAPQRA